MINSVAIGYPCMANATDTAFHFSSRSLWKRNPTKRKFYIRSYGKKTSLSGSARRLVDPIWTVAPLKKITKLPYHKIGSILFFTLFSHNSLLTHAKFATPIKSLSFLTTLGSKITIITFAFVSYFFFLIH